MFRPYLPLILYKLVYMLSACTDFICLLVAYKNMNLCTAPYMIVCFSSDIDYTLLNRGCIPSEVIPAGLDTNRCHEIDPFLPYIRQMAAVCS